MVGPFIIMLLSILVFAFKSDSGNVSLHMELKKLINKKVLILKADVYYNIDGNMTLHYTYPQDHIFITNAKGEAKVYYPSTNQVMLQQNEAFSSENDVLYSFFTQNTSDMGMKQYGFVIKDTRYENELMITSWLPPTNLMNQIHNVEMAYENYLPIYTAIYNSKSKISKKVYYSSYTYVGQYSLPLKITEIEYLANGDSVITRKEYTNVKMGTEAENTYFNFKIPSNATLVKQPPVK